MIYLLDANSFIQAKNLHYRMNVVPGFWEWLTIQHKSIQLQSIQPVYEELTSNKSDPDELAKWALNNKAFFTPTDNQEIQKIFSKIANYLISHATYSAKEVERFLSGADPWLIAAAKAMKAKVVTHEVLVPSNSTKVKIPNVAHDFDVACLDVFDLLELSCCKLILS